MLVQQTIYPAAVLVWRSLEVQQNANLVERHVQTAAMTNEGHAFEMRRYVDAVIALAADGFREQSDLLIVTDRFRTRAGLFSEFSDFHGYFP